MQKGILAPGRHLFKRGRVIRFICSNDLVQELLTGSAEDVKERPPVKPHPVPIRKGVGPGFHVAKLWEEKKKWGLGKSRQPGHGRNLSPWYDAAPW
jgi:hypothetical protein